MMNKKRKEVEKRRGKKRKEKSIKREQKAITSMITGEECERYH